MVDVNVLPVDKSSTTVTSAPKPTKCVAKPTADKSCAARD